MFDCWDTIWLWQGWIQPDSTVGSEVTGAGTTTGSGQVNRYIDSIQSEPSLGSKVTESVH